MARSSHINFIYNSRINMASYALMLLLTGVLAAVAEQEKIVEEVDVEPEVPPPLPRSFSKWNGEDKMNDTNETMQGDESRVHYVTRSPWPYHYRAPLHALVNSADDNSQAYEEALRHYYWTAQYPRSALVDYRTGYPYGTQLSESQMAWIHSLHPELRDRYLKDLFGARANELNYLTYPNGYHWAPHNPYARHAVSVVPKDPVASFDYSCYRTQKDGRGIKIKAPKLPNAYIHRYHRRQNPNHPRNDYLAAEYRCKAGYTLLDSKAHELFCSQSTWVGNPPICVAKFKN